MNETCYEKLFPSKSFITFYYYYTYIILVSCWIIAPLKFYAILTQSKTLQTFKWLIMNHFLWCLALQTLFAFVKPVLLFPTVAGFPLEYPKDGNFKITATLYFISTMLILNKGIALGSTLFCRYFLAFPSSISKWFTFKKVAAFMISATLINYLTLTVFKIYPIFQVEKSDMFKTAMTQNPCLKEFFQNPGFFAMESESAKTGFYVSFIAFIISLFFNIFIMVYFVFRVKSNKAAIISKLQKSLILSAFAELAISIIFIVLPFICFFGILCFEISNTANFSIIIFCFILTHSFLHILITLFFISPYRKFILNLWSIFINFKSISIVPRVYSVY